MMLRPRQSLFVDNSVKALSEYGNTLGVAPTGAGKTICLSAVTESARNQGRALVLQHRDELVSQNRKKYEKVNPSTRTGVVDAEVKNWRQPVTFAMVQTLCRERTLAKMPAVDMITIDEAHHGVADSYQRIIRHARELNPSLLLYGVTATPQRGDKKGLRDLFDNVADQITIGELIQAGHLVKPRTFVIDLGVQEELRQVRRTAQDFDMNEVERIMDHQLLNEQIIEKWKGFYDSNGNFVSAADRKTVVFCSTTTHAAHVMEDFRKAGVNANIITGDTPSGERKRILAEFERGDLQVLINVAVLTEGWDCPPCDCVMLLRPSSQKVTMIQMIGRGLRTVDPEEYPGVVKKDCVVIDFGTSVLMHGSLEQEAVLDGSDLTPGETPTKNCDQCGSTVPLAVRECPICGYEFPVQEEGAEKLGLENVILTEIDLFDASPFRWESLFDDVVLVATAFDAWAMCVFYQGNWHAIGGSKSAGIHHLAVGERLTSLAAADDWMRDQGDSQAAKKSKRWLNMPATEKQLQHLGMSPLEGYGMSRYQAACRLTWKFNERNVRTRLEYAVQGVAA